NKDAPVAVGGSVFVTGNTATNNLNRTGHLAMRGNGELARFDLTTRERIEKMHLNWFNTLNLQKKNIICSEIQQLVIEDSPNILLGASYAVSALRKEWKDFQPQMSLFYTVRKD